MIHVNLSGSRQRLQRGHAAGALLALLCSIGHADPPTALCQGSKFDRDCRPAAGSADQNAPRESIQVGGQVGVPRPESRGPTCQAAVNVSYMQRHDSVVVDAEVHHQGCPRASGEYTVRVRTRAADRTARTREYTEAWSLAGDEVLAHQRTYPMDGDTELVWVKVRSRGADSCRCTPTDPQ